MLADEEDQVVLVDMHDREIGTMAKMAAHRAGRLHRAVSVFLVNRAGELLLQQRAEGKYHSAGRWANTCCGHPRPGEGAAEAAARRLREEMGIECPLRFAGLLTYRADVGGGLVEHEVDHLFIGRFDDAPRPDPREVAGWRWATPAEIERDLAVRPGSYAAWFDRAMRRLQALVLR